MYCNWLIISISAILLLAGCFANDPSDLQDNDPVVTVDTLKTETEEVDTIHVGVNEQNPPQDSTTKNIPDIKEDPIKPVVKKKGPKISFKEMSYSWGEIEQGEKITKAFHFTNTGDTPLNVLSASATCGCTMPSYPFLPINPGGKGKIEVSYDSRLKHGPQEAKVTVQTDANPKTYYLMLSGNVKEKPKTPEEPKDTSSIEG